MYRVLNNQLRMHVKKAEKVRVRSQISSGQPQKFKSTSEVHVSQRRSYQLNNSLNGTELPWEEVLTCIWLAPCSKSVLTNSNTVLPHCMFFSIHRVNNTHMGSFILGNRAQGELILDILILGDKYGNWPLDSVPLGNTRNVASKSGEICWKLLLYGFT